MLYYQTTIGNDNRKAGLLNINNTNATNTNATNTNATNAIVFYFTESDEEGSDVCPKPNYCVSEQEPFGNRIYRYEWDNSTGKLINPVLTLDLPAGPVPIHNGGKLIIGPDSNIYFTIGDLNHKSATQNFPDRSASMKQVASIELPKMEEQYSLFLAMSIQ